MTAVTIAPNDVADDVADNDTAPDTHANGAGPNGATPQFPVLPQLDPAALAQMTDEQLRQQMETLRQLNAMLRQTATERGIAPPSPKSGRPLTASSLLAAARQKARLQFLIDRYTGEFNEAEAQFNAAQTRYLESNGFAEIPEGAQTLIDDAYNSEYTKRQQQRAESSAPAEGGDGEAQPRSRRGRPRKDSLAASIGG